jgi:hypothetical protein
VAAQQAISRPVKPSGQLVQLIAQSSWHNQYLSNLS